MESALRVSSQFMDCTREDYSHRVGRVLSFSPVVESGTPHARSSDAVPLSRDCAAKHKLHLRKQVSYGYNGAMC